MLNNNGFDLWSSSYDGDVTRSDETDSYPFAGYARLMNAVFGTVMQNAPARVLDVGFGTAALTSRLYDVGCEITGIDFSAEMVRAAQEKMPEAMLLQWDFTNGMPTQLYDSSFDFIISTYAIHHLNDDAKAVFITQMLERLTENGAILIGDVAFSSRERLIECKTQSGAAWDDDEIYIVAPELEAALPKSCICVFHELSRCAGIMEIKKRYANNL